MGQIPFVPCVSGLLCEKTWDATCRHGVKNRTPGEGIPWGCR